MTDKRYDVMVVGAGIAGASVAAELGPHASVLLLEAEARPDLHSTGRAVAVHNRNYGNLSIDCLTAGARELLAGYPHNFASRPILNPRGVLWLATPGQEGMLDEAVSSSVGLARLSRDEAAALVPALDTGAIAGAAHDAAAAEVDVPALHGGYLDRARSTGVRLVCGARLRAMARRGGAWQVQTAAGAFEAGVVVNAAGAWADRVAALCGAAPAGLVAMRRSVALVPAPPGSHGWPRIGDIGETFFVQPMDRHLAVAPAEEWPAEGAAEDAGTAEIDNALARARGLLKVGLGPVERRWAGTRTYAPDRSPVIGWDAGVEGLFWVAGLGGYGIQIAPATAALAGRLIRGLDVPAALARRGFTPAELAPGRAGLREGR